MQESFIRDQVIRTMRLQNFMLFHTQGSNTNTKMLQSAPMINKRSTIGQMIDPSGRVPPRDRPRQLDHDLSETLSGYKDLHKDLGEFLMRQGNAYVMLSENRIKTPEEVEEMNDFLESFAEFCTKHDAEHGGGLRHCRGPARGRGGRQGRVRARDHARGGAHAQKRRLDHEGLLLHGDPRERVQEGADGPRTRAARGKASNPCS